MKKILFLLLILLSSCNTPGCYHGLVYDDTDDIKTLPLVAFQDNESQTITECFVICLGEQTLKYRVLVEFPDGIMKMIEFEPNNLFVKYSDNPTITTKVKNFKYLSYWSEVTLEIPKNSIKYENILDGK